MEEQLLAIVTSAIFCAPVISGITGVFKKYTNIEGIEIILTAFATGIILFGAVAYVFTFPMLESLLLGALTGLASVGAFKGIDEAKELKK